MQRFSSPFGTVTLTDERKAHILAYHPDVRKYLRHFAQTLSNPGLVISSAHDRGVVICYGLLPKSQRHLAVVVKISAKPFILTAYVAKRPKKP